jgi:hypothetical protein
MYLYLSHFQDGIGDLVLDCKLPSSLAVPAAAHLRRNAISDGRREERQAQTRDRRLGAGQLTGRPASNGTR